MSDESSRRERSKSAAPRLVAVWVSVLLVGSAVAGVAVAGSAVPDATLAETDVSPADTAIAQDDGATEISSCTTITEPGDYVLVADVENASGTCIEITADEVRLDGAGHTIDGTDSPFARRSAVRATGADNVTVTNLTATDFGFAGVYFRGVSGGRIENVTATGNRFGITARTSGWLRIANSTVANNAGGIDLSTAKRSVVADNVVRNNRIGVSLSVTTKHVRVTRNEIRDNRIGVAVSNSFSNVVTSNLLCDNRRAFASLEGAERNEFVNNRQC